MSWPWNTSTAYLSIPASTSAACSFVSGTRRSRPETSPTKCLCNWRMAIAMARLSRMRCFCGKATPARDDVNEEAARQSCVPRHEPTIHRNDGAGQEGGGGQAQAQGHMG